MNFLKIFYCSLLLILLSSFLWAQERAVNKKEQRFILSSTVPSGFYNKSISLLLETNRKDALIYYSTDGSIPSKKSEKYSGPLYFSKTVNLQAIAIDKKGKKSELLTRIYLIAEPNTNFPIINLTVNPSALFDNRSGLFKKGNNASSEHPYYGANYYSKREIPCYMEFIESPDTSGKRALVFSGKLGFSIFGGVSRVFPQKSIALYARSNYGPSYITHQVFPELKYQKYKRLVLRNSGSDYGETHFRDAFITSMGKQMGLDVQAYRPALVYINGRYWGILNIREKLSKFYFEQHYDIGRDSIDLLENRFYEKAGSRKHYQKMQAFMGKNDLSVQENFDKVAQMMDVDNFMEYQIIQIYIDNQDAGGNVKFWRPQKPDGKWRWVLFDTDFGFGHYSKGGYKFNTLKMFTASDGPVWPCPPWSTFNLRMLLKNEDFKTKFISRFCDRLNSTFEGRAVIARIDSMAARIKPELPRHWKRWELNPKDWEFRVNQMKEFALKRPAFMRYFLQKMFPEIGEEVQVFIDIDGAGKIILNEVVDIKKAFKGYYFQNLRIELKAEPYFDNLFSHWEINGQKAGNNRRLELGFDSEKINIKAVFVKGISKDVNKMIINEISCRDSNSGDWIEFYNNSNTDLNVKGWTVIDESKNSFVFPDVVIPAKDYLVVCKEEEKFRKMFPDKINFIGKLGFGLGAKRDRIEVYDGLGLPIDSVSYNVGASKDSVFLSLALRDFESDNSNFKRNWKYDKKGGSPGKINPQYLQWTNQSKSASDDGTDLNRYMKTVWAALYFFVGAIVFSLIILLFRKQYFKKN